MVSRRNKSHRRSTKSKSKRRGGVTVESLHASFDHINTKVRTMIAQGRTDSELSCCLRKAWSEQFHHDLSPAAVKGMIVHYRSIHKGASRKTRKQKQKQSGGMAPIDWTPGQGTTDFVYGRFPIEMGTSHQVVKALDLGRFVESRGGRSCDATGGHAAPAQTGGGVADALATGHAPNSVPNNLVSSYVRTAQGVDAVSPGASPISASVPLASHPPSAYNAGAIHSIASIGALYAPSV